MKEFLLLLLFFSTLSLRSQNPIPVQVALPVYFEDVGFIHEYSQGKPPVAELCGIALYFLDTLDTKERIIVSDLEDPIIWVDKVGISNKVKFVVAGSEAVSSLNLTYANKVCTIDFERDGETYANGSISMQQGKYVMRLIGKNEAQENLIQLIESLNDYLLHLHTKEQKVIPISPLFDPESLNVIIGYDYSFDTNFDLTWFDASLRQRIRSVAETSYKEIMADPGRKPIQKTAETNTWVEHSAQIAVEKPHMIEGNVSTLFNMRGDKNYLFLRPRQQYYFQINYKYQSWENRPGRLMIEKFSIKNRENDDFIEMDLFDYTWNGVPVLYVDLINGVVMEEEGAWKADQFISAIQDIFRLVRFPNEY